MGFTGCSSARKSKEKTNFFSDDYCESNVKCSLRFGRGHLLSLVPLLALLSLLSNVFFVVRHNNDMAFLAEQKQLRHRQYVTKELLIDMPVEKIMSAEKMQAKKKEREAKKKKLPLMEPTKESLSPNATLSACLLIKDDNELLSEWIAYHYHTMNLRFLVVAVDPLSTESPLKILERWHLLTDLEILVWSDERFMPDYFVENGQPPAEYLQDSSDFEDASPEGLMQISNHRYRQRVFLAECMKVAKRKGKTWTMHIDTDEYIVPSKLFRQVRTEYVKPKPIEEPGSILDLLQQTTGKTPSLVNYPCISMMRLLFGSVESQNDDDALEEVPDGFNATRFESLRWQYHAPPANMSYHGNPKVIIDVSAIPKKYLPHELVYSIHRPVLDYCRKNKNLEFSNYHKQPIAANHYLGSWERYNQREDNRRSRAVYDKKALVNAGRDDGIRPWLKGFVDHMGIDRASELLGDYYMSAGTKRNPEGGVLKELFSDFLPQYSS